MLTDEQVAKWQSLCDAAAAARTALPALLADRAELVAEVEKLREAYWRARACGSVETCNAECWDCMFPPHDDDQEATR